MATKKVKDPEKDPAVLEVAGDGGDIHYASRKDGAPVEVDEDEFARNKNAALPPTGNADFTSNVKP